MNFVLLTQDNGKILGPIAKYILGPILNGIFVLLDWLPWNNSANVSVAIILFTIVIYILLLPLTIKQQKFSKLQAKMQPEIHAIQEKYKNKKDQNSQMAMSQETQAVYQKYGVSPTGSCVQLLIQMPILFALYRVINNIPAYVGIIKNAFTGLVDKLYELPGSADFLKTLEGAKYYSNNFDKTTDIIARKNLYIDVLNKATSADWDALSKKFPDLKDSIDSTMVTINSYNNFLGINIGYSPMNTIKQAFSTGAFLLLIIAVLIPVLSAVTQWINVKLTPQAASNSKDGQPDQAASTMKAMNTFMPLFSAFMCFTLPAGLGIYWIAGSVVRSVEQVLINKHIDKIDLEAEIKKNVEKRNAKLRKAGIDPDKLTQNASLSTKAMKNSQSSGVHINKTFNVGSADSDSTTNTNSNNKNINKPGSIASKANMVRQYNEKNNK